MNFLSDGKVMYFPFEIDFIVWLQHLGEGTFFQTVLLYLNNFFSMFGEELIMVAVMGAIYWGFNKHKGERIGLFLLTANLVNPLIKNIVKRLRPWQVSGKIELLRDVDGYSFPSGHSCSSAAIYPGIAMEYKEKKMKWLTVLCIVIPILVALSRNYLGAHFLTDVLVGLCVGLLVLFILQLLLDVVKNKYYIYVALIVLGAAGIFYCDTTDYFTSYGMLIGFVLGILFEERVTKFENTLCWWRIILRTAVGGGLYIAINSLIKLIFGGLFVTDSPADFAFRTIRYAIITFTLIGVYPLLFKVFDKIFLKWGWIKQKTQDAVSENDNATENAEVLEDGTNA